MGGVPDLLDHVDVGGYDGNDEDVERQLVVEVAPHVVAGRSESLHMGPIPTDLYSVPI